MTDSERDTVPGMAEAVEGRRLQRGLTSGEFALAAKCTRQALKPVRDGVRKDYAEKVRLGVSRALLWPVDWYDRLQAGEAADDLIEPSRRVIDAIEHDTALDDRARAELLAVYHSLIG